jgi:NarL family two-component system response regulator LiaR
MTHITVLIVDDHPLMRQAMCLALETEPDMTVAAEASDGRQAVDMALTLQPDVVVMDLYLPHLDGLAATREILAQNPAARILVITSSTEDAPVVAALQAGATGYLLKDAASDTLLEAIRLVAAGQTFIPPNVAAKLAGGLRQSAPPPPAPPPLTRREHEVMALLGEGLTDDEMARQLSLTVSTVRVHIFNMLRKLGLQNRQQAVLYLLKQNPPDAPSKS